MKEQWINEGYRIFAIEGEKGLKIETLAKKISISKSSFYHHFAEMEVFMEYLLNHHLKQSEIIAQKEKNANKINPDLVNILVEHKIDLLFNRQLRIHQQVDSFKTTLQKSNQIIGNAFIEIWIKDLQLTLSFKQLEGLFQLALENFFLQINIDNIQEAWLTQYFEGLKNIAKSFE